jgi:hypothetical protein
VDENKTRIDATIRRPPTAVNVPRFHSHRLPIATFLGNGRADVLPVVTALSTSSMK